MRKWNRLTVDLVGTMYAVGPPHFSRKVQKSVNSPTARPHSTRLKTRSFSSRQWRARQGVALHLSSADKPTAYGFDGLTVYFDFHHRLPRTWLVERVVCEDLYVRLGVFRLSAFLRGEYSKPTCWVELDENHTVSTTMADMY